MKRRRAKLQTIVSSVLIAVCFGPAANADNRGEPSTSSVATITACKEARDTVRACATKDLSNVVLQCQGTDGTTVLVKFDDLTVGNVSSFSCTDPDTGIALGDVVALWVKAGSRKGTDDPAFVSPVPGKGTGSAITLWPVQCTDPTPTEPEPCAQDAARR